MAADLGDHSPTPSSGPVGLMPTQRGVMWYKGSVSSLGPTVKAPTNRTPDSLSLPAKWQRPQEKTSKFRGFCEG